MPLKVMARAVAQNVRNGVMFWRAVWTGENPRPTFGTGAKECARRRRQLLAGRFTSNYIYKGDYLGALRTARQSLEGLRQRLAA